MEKNRVVKSILFDVVYKGVKYPDLDFGYHNDPEVTEEYIHSEDGPWSMQSLGDDVIDFQIWADPDKPCQLIISACQVEMGDNGTYCHTDFIGSEDIDISNIRVEYEKEVAEDSFTRTISVTLYGLDKKDFKKIERDFIGSYSQREDGRYNVTINLFDTNDKTLCENIRTGNCFIGLS